MSQCIVFPFSYLMIFFSNSFIDLVDSLVVSSMILEGVLKRGESLWNNIVMIAFVVSHVYVKILF